MADADRITESLERVQQLLQENDVILFCKTRCKCSQEIRDFLKDIGIQFRNVEMDAPGEGGGYMHLALMHVTPYKTVPSLFVRGQMIGGIEAVLGAYNRGVFAEFGAREGVTIQPKTKRAQKQADQVAQVEPTAPKVEEPEAELEVPEVEEQEAPEGEEPEVEETEGPEVEEPEVPGVKELEEPEVEEPAAPGVKELEEPEVEEPAAPEVEPQVEPQPGAEPGPTPVLPTGETTDEFDYDLIVIGGGSGGLAASKQAADHGQRVAVCDYVTPTPKGTKWGLGGTCVNVGCIPKKLMHTASLIGHWIEDSHFFGWKVPEEGKQHDWLTMIQTTQGHIKSLNFGYRKYLKEKNVTYLNSRARFADPHTIITEDAKGNVATLRASTFIIAVGSRPKYLDIPGALEYAITSDDLFSLKYPPGDTLVVGASYIACECAGFLAGVGFTVTIMVRSKFMRMFDEDMATMIQEQMESLNIAIKMGYLPTSIEQLEEGQPGRLKVVASNAEGGKEEFEYNTVLIAIGRTACTEYLNLDAIGVKLNPESGKLVHDVNEQTTLPHIYGIGDCLHGKPELTPVAVKAGKLLANRLFGGATTLMDYVNIPTTVYSPMEYSFVGMSNKEAEDAYGGEDNIEIYHIHFDPLEFALSDRDCGVAYCKVVCVISENERIVGMHYFGPSAGEVMQGFALGVKLGATKKDLDKVVGIHPTCAEEFTTLDITKRSGLDILKTHC